MMVLTGCVRKDILVMQPDSSALIVRAKGWVELSLYDPVSGEMVLYGKVDAEEYVGWTLHKYDWSRVLPR